MKTILKLFLAGMIAVLALNAPFFISNDKDLLVQQTDGNDSDSDGGDTPDPEPTPEPETNTPDPEPTPEPEGGEPDPESTPDPNHTRFKIHIS